MKGHYNNYHKSPPPRGATPVAILRDPLEYYVSLASFWCLDPNSCDDDQGLGTRPLERDLGELLREYEVRSTRTVGHPKYWISRGFTERSLAGIVGNVTDPNFIRAHAEKVSRKHHTYDSRPFADMERLGVGYYTWAFLDQCSRKRVSAIGREELRAELDWIAGRFRFLHQSTLDADLERLCRETGVPFTPGIRVRVSRKTKEGVPPEIVERIQELDGLVAAATVGL